MSLPSGFSQAFLPLSWRQGEHFKVPHFESFQLAPVGPDPSHWITFADLPPLHNPKALADTFNTFLQQQHITRWVIRGAHPRFFEALPQPVHRLLTGREALLSLSHSNHVQRSSIRELARRGRRHGQICAVDLRIAPLPDPLALAYAHLKSKVTQHYQVPLVHMYRRNVAQSDRLWLFVDQRPGASPSPAHVLGAVSLIQNGAHSWHTEVLMRHPEAPVGIMEALICEIFNTLAAEQQGYWSLGEVPFYPTATLQDIKARAIVYTGQHIEFAYRSSGLRHFKDKFKPFWRPVYLCGAPRLYWSDLARMFWSSHASQLVLKKGLGLPIKIQGLA